MSDKPVNDLLKYPVIVISVVLGLVLTEWWLGIDLSRITEVGPQGLKLAQETREDARVVTSELSVEISDLGAALADLSSRVDAMEGTAMTKSTGPAPTPVKPPVDEVPDAAARLSRNATGGRATALKGQEGYIFIGNHDGRPGGWTDPVLLRLDSAQPEADNPEVLLPGTQFRLRLNMFLRADVPPNSREYFRAIKSLGVVPRGTLVTLLDRPVEIDRESAVQYWAKVEVVE